MNHPDWINKAAEEIVTGIKKLLEKTQEPGSPKPPPGTVSDYVRNTIAKHTPRPTIAVREAVKAKVEANEALTPDQIYVKPTTVTSDVKVLGFIKSRPSCRLSDVVKETGLEKSEIEKIVTGNGYKVAKPAGWIKEA